MYSIRWRRRATKSLRKIDPSAHPKILSAVGGLTAWPNCRNVKTLNNHTYDYRLRVGRYRVFFNVNDTIEIVMIEEVKKRDDQTY